MKRLGIKNRPIYIVEKEVKNEDDVKNELVKQRNFQQDRYIEFLRRFLNEKCEYDYQRINELNDVKKAYQKFIAENKQELTKYNVNYSLTVGDIPKLDNRFEVVQHHVCKSCKCKQYRGCCENYDNKNKSKYTYVINLKLKDFQPDVQLSTDDTVPSGTL